MRFVPVYLGARHFTARKPNIGKSLALEPPTKSIALHQLKPNPDSTPYGNRLDIRYVPDNLRWLHGGMLSLA